MLSQCLNCHQSRCEVFSSKSWSSFRVAKYMAPLCIANGYTDINCNVFPSFSLLWSLWRSHKKTINLWKGSSLLFEMRKWSSTVKSDRCTCLHIIVVVYPLCTTLAAGGLCQHYITFCFKKLGLKRERD